jgi:methylmalonyl-CoA mutase
MEELWQEFNKPDFEQWKEKIISELRGKEYESILRDTPEGIKIEPISPRKSGNHVLPGITRHFSWEIMQEYFVDDEKKVNSRVLHDLQKGASSLLFYVLPGVNLQTLLKDIEWPHVEIHFVSEGNGYHLWQEIRKLADIRKWHLDVLRGSINVDCLENLARTGNFFHDLESDMDDIRKYLEDRPGKMYSTCINANLFQNAGAPADLQLGIALSMLHEYYDHLGSAAWERVWVNLAIGGRYFMEIAKFRSMRILWSNLIKLYGLDAYEHKMQLHADSSLRNKAIFGPHNNILRSTTEAMSAAIGTADSIGLRAYNSTYKENDDFGNHMARNIQLLLKHESFFDKVIDPASGSYFVEFLTEQLCNKAWVRFQQIEDQGGYIASLKNGYLQKIIEEWAEVENEAFEDGSMPVLGVNLFPYFEEPSKEDIKAPLFCPPSDDRERIVEPLRPYRMAEKIEKEQIQGS